MVHHLGRVVLAFLLPCLLLVGQTEPIAPPKDDRTLRPQQATPVQAEQRVALVIGNGSYKEAPLRNPVNDARAMAEALGKSGFAVTELENANRSQMREAIRTFGARITEGGVGLFYFAGHGMQVKGRNFLVPVGADIAQEDEVAGEAVEVDAVLAKMETARNRLNILILDACRNNPFGRSFRSTQQGLAQVDAPTGTFVAFATAPGRTAADGSGTNGLYTEALLRQFQAPGLKLEEVFKRTRAEVLKASSQQQTPWENSSIVGDFYFIPGSALSGSMASASPVGTPAPTSAQPAAPPPSPAEAKLLDEVRAGRLGGVREFKKLAAPLAAKGSIYGKFVLGWLSKEDGVYYRAITQGAKQGIPLAMAYLAEFLVASPVSPDDPVEARNWLNKAIELGEPQAKFVLGKLLMKGKLGPLDIPAAERLFAEATRDFLPYCTIVGDFYLYEFDLGIPREEADAKALAYFRRAADLGDGQAMERLGTYYEELDFGEAVRWFTEGAAYGHVGCMFELGNLYRRTKDPNHQDGKAALQWYERAAGRGDLLAVEIMADMYRDGKVVPKDLPQALTLYRRAAEKGFKTSQQSLGEMYEQGLGVPRSLPQAYFWFVLEAEGRWEQGEQNRKRLAAQLAPAERTRIEALAAKWKLGRDYD
jgi:TPR repeat protein